MKKLFALALIALFAGMAFTGCEKEELRFKSKSFGELAPELQKLYMQMPKSDYGKISIVGDDILKFESEEHYEDVYESLKTQYELWTDLFVQKYGSEGELKLNQTAESLDFDENFPLQIFEEKYGIIGKNLRSECAIKEKIWMDKGTKDLPPIDSIINCPIEQTLYSKFHEICINNTIYQFRNNGTCILIPLSVVNIIDSIRKIVDINNLKELFPYLKVQLNEEGCHSSYFHKEGFYFPYENNTRNFTWSFLYKKAKFHRYKATVTMTNYKLRNGKWKKELVKSDIGFSSNIYNYNFGDITCTPNGNLGETLYNERYFRSESITKRTLPVSTEPDSSSVQIFDIYLGRNELNAFHIEPEESYVKLKYDGIEYKFNVNSGCLIE